MTKILWIILIFAVLPYSFLDARSFYVNPVIGNDANEGISANLPWKTLQKVNDSSFLPGDSVLFACGTVFHGQLKIHVQGEKKKIILFSSYGSGSMPVIAADGQFEEAVLLYNSSYVTVKNLEITNTGVTRKPLRKGVYLFLDNYGEARQISLDHLYIHDVNGSDIKALGGGAGISWDNRGNRIKSRFDGLLIENCKLVRTDRNGITGGGYTRRDNWYPNLHVVIRGNELYDIGGDGIVPIGCDGAIVEYNRLIKGGQRFPEGDASAGIWPWSCDNTLIQYNEVAYMAGPWDSQGYDSDWNCKHSVFQYNYSHDNLGGFFLICSPTKGNEAGNNGTVIRYNISYNDGGRVTWKSAGFSPIFHITGPVKDIKIYHNIVIRDRAVNSKEDKSLITFNTWGGDWPSHISFTHNYFVTTDTFTCKYGEATAYSFLHNHWRGHFTNCPKNANRDNISITKPLWNHWNEKKIVSLLRDYEAGKVTINSLFSILKLSGR
ncbi:right-handed parallel beta-helix repeat-containing protein [Microbacter margulisiae]|uniref:Right handed beta helix domain-containing protein n=1 Tax=Microbacter margulisiae TaxID=1350067 RepID=A0A7W5DQS1_9PORP|nr:right-handed parallel beta-helix repeat-containing protein [Microbacter margulisiae]MBB3187360.1 hypothetical protein [Microbacter margulisiae]